MLNYVEATSGLLSNRKSLQSKYHNEGGLVICMRIYARTYKMCIKLK
jgi:hypothetical protein